MRSRCAVLAGLLVLAVAVGQAQETKAKFDKSKLVGTWVFVKTDAKEGPPKGSTFKVEFTKDGKCTQTFTFEGKSDVMKGTYTAEGDKLTITIKPKDKEVKDVYTIKELTDKKLVTLEKTKDKTETVEFKKEK